MPVGYMSEQYWVRRAAGRVLRFRARRSSAEIHCGDVRANGSDYLEGDISESLSEGIRAHLGLCDGCQGWLSGLWSTIRLLRALPKAEPPESLITTIRRQG